MIRRNTLRLFASILPAVLALNAFGNGFRLGDQDAFATARGEAFVATADNSSAIYYNPAGIAQLEGSNLRGGFYGISIDMQFRPPRQAANHGHTYYDQENFAAVPQFFYTCTPGDSPLSFGLGCYSPYGLSALWPQDTGFRTVGIKGSLTYIRFAPVAALKLAPNFSLGAGLAADDVKLDLMRGIIASPNRNLQRFIGNGWGVGYNFGALWQPDEKFSIGATFRSATSVPLDGHTELQRLPFLRYTHVKADADFDFPLTAVVGLSYRPTPKWNLEFDADYTDWSSLGTVFVNQHAKNLLYGQDFRIKLYWTPSWLYEVGVTRYFGNGWQLSAGYVFDQNSMPDAHYQPLIADMDRHFFSAGTGYKGKRFNFDIAYQFGYGPTRTVRGSEVTSPGGQSADGNYKFDSMAVLFSAGVHF